MINQTGNYSLFKVQSSLVIVWDLPSGFHLSQQVVCERGELLASGCAVARAFPTYSSKTASTPPQTVTVGFIVVGGGASPVTDDDIKCLSAECEGGWSFTIVIFGFLFSTSVCRY